MIIAITGTPGVGKTKVSKILAKLLDFKLIELNKEIKKNKLYSGYDRYRKTYIADMNKIKKFIKKLSKEYPNIIIDSHLSHYIPSDIVIVLRCKPTELEKRLKKKRWNKEKRKENVEAELISLISWEAREKNKNVYDIDTTGKKPKEVVNEIELILKGVGKRYKKQIDWM